MPAAVDRPPNTALEGPEASPEARIEFDEISAHQTRARRRTFIDRYQQHLWIGGLSILIIAVALSPLILGYISRQPAPSKPVAAAAPSNLATNVTITATEF